MKHFTRNLAGRAAALLAVLVVYFAARAAGGRAAEAAPPPVPADASGNVPRLDAALAVTAVVTLVPAATRPAGKGVLEFHVLVEQPNQEQPAIVKRFAERGPESRDGDEAAWYPVDRPDEFRQPALVSKTNGRTYALVWATPDRAMGHGPGDRGWGIERAYRQRTQFGAQIVAFDFDRRGAELFGALTEHNLNKPLAIVLDGRILTAPVIRSKITRSCWIDGGAKGFTDADLTRIIDALNANARPAPATAPATAPSPPRLPSTERSRAP